MDNVERAAQITILRSQLAKLEAGQDSWQDGEPATEVDLLGPGLLTGRDSLSDERRMLEVLNQTGAELNLERLVQIVTDAGVKLVGAQFGAFFYTNVDESAVLHRPRICRIQPCSGVTCEPSGWTKRCS